VTALISVPIPVEDRIKVTLMSPNLAEKTNVVLDDDNNVRWNLQINPNEDKTVECSYTIECPRNCNLHFY